MTRDKTLIVITGPTASGKSALAVDLAQKLNTEIISADSRQVFQGIPIVTAMPTAEQRVAAPHHLIDFLPLSAYYSAARFAKDALEIAEKIWQSSQFAIICGGSMMYIDALCDGIDELPTIPDSLRQTLRNQHIAYGDNWLRAYLHQLDEDYYNVVDLNNMKRVFHAVEISLAAGCSYSQLRKGVRKEHPFKIIKIGIEYPRHILFERINLRVESMLEQGLEREARRVYHLRELNSLNTVGLKEMFTFFDGGWDFDTAVSRIQKNTRVYAKKQLTWLKRKDDIHWLDATEPDLSGRALEIILKD